MRRFTLTSEDFYRLNILSRYANRNMYKNELGYQEQQNADAVLFRKLQAIVDLKLDAEWEVTQIKKPKK